MRFGLYNPASEPWEERSSNRRGYHVIRMARGVSILIVHRNVRWGDDSRDTKRNVMGAQDIALPIRPLMGHKAATKQYAHHL